MIYTVRTLVSTIQFLSGSELITFDKKCNIKNVAGGIKITDKDTTAVISYDQIIAPSSLASNDEMFTFLSEVVLDDEISFPLQYSKSILEKEGIYTSVVGKSKALLKFGANDAISNTVYSTIQTFPSGRDQEVFLTDNLITHFASTNAGDVGLEVVVEGHQVIGGQLIFTTQTVTLNGQNKTALETPLRSVSRAFNNNGTLIAGTVYFSQDVSYSTGVPSDPTKVHMIIPSGAQQTQKLSTSVSYTDVWFISSVNFNVIEKTATTMSARLITSEYGKVPRTQETLSASSDSNNNTIFDPLFTVKPNSDIRVDALSSSDNQSASGSLQGYLAKVIAR